MSLNKLLFIDVFSVFGIKLDFYVFYMKLNQVLCMRLYLPIILYVNKSFWFIFE